MQLDSSRSQLKMQTTAQINTFHANQSNSNLLKPTSFSSNSTSLLSLTPLPSSHFLSRSSSSLSSSFSSSPSTSPPMQSVCDTSIKSNCSLRLPITHPASSLFALPSTTVTASTSTSTSTVAVTSPTHVSSINSFPVDNSFCAKTSSDQQLLNLIQNHFMFNGSSSSSPSVNSHHHHLHHNLVPNLSHSRALNSSQITTMPIVSYSNHFNPSLDPAAFNRISIDSNKSISDSNDNGLPASCEPIASFCSFDLNSNYLEDNWPFIVQPNEALAERILNDESEFNRQLYRLMQSIGKPIQRVPHLGFKRLNLYEFFRIAARLGGYTWITRNRDWKRVYDSISDDRKSTSAATCTRRHYETLLLPFERYVQRLRGSNEPPIRQVARLQRGRKPKMLSERSEQIERLMRVELNLLPDDTIESSESQVERPLSEVQNLHASKPSEQTETNFTLSVTNNETSNESDWTANQAFLTNLLHAGQWKVDGSEPNLLLPRKRGRRPKYIKELQEQLGLSLDRMQSTNAIDTRQPTPTLVTPMRNRVHSFGSTQEIRKRPDVMQSASRTLSKRTLRLSDDIGDLPTEQETRKRSQSFGTLSDVRLPITSGVSESLGNSSNVLLRNELRSSQAALDLRIKAKEDDRRDDEHELSAKNNQPSDAIQQALNAYLLQCYRIALEGQVGC